MPYQVFATRDGHVVLAVGNDAQFARFCAEAGVHALAEDARYRTNADRVANRHALTAALAPVMAARTSADWLAALPAAGVPCGPIRDVAEALASEEARARGMVLDHGDRRTVASPVDLGGRDAATPPPALGQHTDAVLAELGLDAEEVVRLRVDGTVG